MDYDLTLDRACATDYVDRHGWDKFLAHLEQAAGRQLDLYSVGIEWTRNPSITSIKAKGSRGDVLVRLIP